MASIADIRAKFPEYSDLSDEQLADGVYKKFYSDMPRGEFQAKMGLGPIQLSGQVQPQEQPTTEVSPNVAMAPNQRSAAQFGYDQSLAQIKRKYYPDMSDEKWAQVAKEIYKPQNALDIVGDAGMLGLKDEVTGLAAAVPHLFDGKFQEVRNDFTRLGQTQRDLGLEQMGGAALPLEIGGAILGGGTSLPNVLTKAAPMAVRALQGGAQAAGQGAMYSFGATDGDFADRAKAAGTAAAISAPLGAAAPMVGKFVSDAFTKGAQRKVTNAAIKGAPTGSELANAGSKMFETLDQQGVAIAPRTFGKFAMDLADLFKKKRANPRLEKNATPALEDILRAATDAMKSGKGLHLSDLHTFRQIAQKAAQSGEGRDAFFANAIVRRIDEMVGKLKTTDIVGGADPKQSANLLLEGISTWHRAAKVSLMEEAIYQAQNAASGFENGLRIQFRRLLKPDMRGQFSAAEIEAIEKVANGQSLDKVVRFLGKFGFGTGGPGNVLGGMIGYGTVAAIPGVGPLAALIAPIVGTISRKASEKITQNAAQRATQVMATPGIKSLPLLPSNQAGKAEGLLRQFAPLPQTQLQ